MDSEDELYDWRWTAGAVAYIVVVLVAMSACAGCSGGGGSAGEPGTPVVNSHELHRPGVYTYRLGGIVERRVQVYGTPGMAWSLAGWSGTTEGMSGSSAAPGLILAPGDYHLAVSGRGEFWVADHTVGR